MEQADRWTRRRIAATLFSAQSLYTAAVIVAFTLSPIIAAELAGRDGAAGLPSGFVLAGRAMIAFPIGWLMDRIGRRRGLTLGYIAGLTGGLVSIVGIMAGSLLLFLGGALLLGMLRGTAEQGRYAAAEVFPESRRARIIGIIVFAGTLGAVGGPLLVAPATKLAEGRGLPSDAGPFLVATVMLAIGGALILLFLRPDPMQLRQDDLQAQADTRSVPLLTIFARRPVQVAVLALIIGQLVMVVLMVLTPLHMDRQEHGPGLISAVVMAHTLGMYGLSGVTGWLVDRFGRHAVIFAGGSLLVAAAILTPAANSVPLLAFALFLLGLGWNFCFVAGSSLLANAVTNRERGSVQGASDTLVAVASGAGSLSAGLLYEGNGMIVPGGAGVVLASLLLGFTLFVMWRRTKPIGMATTQDS